MVKTFNDVAVAETIPELRTEITLVRLAAYAAATWDFAPVHLDYRSAEKAGLKAPFVDGQMFGGFLVRMLQDWGGPLATITKLSFRNRSFSYVGDTVICRGVVEEKKTDGKDQLALCRLWAENQDGVKLVEPASAVVRFAQA